MVRAPFECCCFFFFSSRRRHTRSDRDWSSDVCSSDLLARPDDLRGDLQRLCSSLPSHWGLEPGQLAAFVAAAGRARVGLADASALCARIVASARAHPGGLALLADSPAAPASPEELGALFRNVRKYRHIGGFQQLLSAL